MEEYLKVINENVLSSRKEPGCLRFDLLKESENKYVFYEGYVDENAVTFHKEQAHYLAWDAFKASG